MRPILALNCLLQIEQERSEEESSVADALTLAFHCARLDFVSIWYYGHWSKVFISTHDHYLEVKVTDLEFKC